MAPIVRVRVSGPLACFTRPEAKVERMSYDLPTPSAARGILDSICWRPQMRWHVRAIEVLRPVRTIALRRNEVQSKVTVKGKTGVTGWMADPAGYVPFAAGAGSEEGTPRATLALKDVAYVIEAEPMVFDGSGDNTPQKYAAMLTRRVEKGQCHIRPCLGCREFAADFCPPDPAERPIAESRDLGRMLYDIIFDPEAGNTPVFFQARLANGRMETRAEEVVADEALRRRVLACSYRH
ncbi:CRISPR-associated protein Cas5 family [Desulfovibrio sp. X2]|uniref:type I-C CRISPR-associated protein Cas5c n=1 Tax=Desulfovibrio sp. X2 TaxID=941449 RepID=UPI000358B133|nr:type I-C CRISPR-associated protein Cas5c [Desulfovibrio sp. X2]EPR43456.1 CRISPR-associated protein Cas5 family [Desulfovibrio sp. X2]